MNLSELKVGMRVRHESWQSYVKDETVLFAGAEVLVTENPVIGECVYTTLGDGRPNYGKGWIVIEPKKKPSVRIFELAKTYSDHVSTQEYISGIMAYLDEQFDKESILTKGEK